MYLKKCGFSNPDVMYSIIENGSLFALADEFANNDTRYVEYVYNNLRQLIKVMNNHSKENIVSKKLMRDNKDMWHFDDMYRMYIKIKEHDSKLLDSVHWSGSLAEIHDDLSMISTKIRYANKEIPYQKSDRELEGDVDDYTFKLAVDTNELVAIGQEMKICVGSYRETALSRRSIIVSMISHNKYVGCIEIDSSKNLRQLKGKRNSYLVGPAADAARKWLKLTGIKSVTRCHDFVHLGEAIETRTDFHHLELDERGEVVDNHHVAYNPFLDFDPLPF
jgi:hypothetical protein